MIFSWIYKLLTDKYTLRRHNCANIACCVTRCTSVFLYRLGSEIKLSLLRCKSQQGVAESLHPHPRHQSPMMRFAYFNFYDEPKFRRKFTHAPTRVAKFTEQYFSQHHILSGTTTYCRILPVYIRPHKTLKYKFPHKTR
jgi:hypothetical protein